MTTTLSHQQQRGFTLVELMIVLAIITILISVAYPAYNGYVLRSHRAVIQAHLQQAAHWLERAAIATGRYPTAAEQSAALQALQDQLSTARYALDITSSDGISFTLTAEPQGPQTNDSCGTLTVLHTGQRTAAGSGSSTEPCWSR